jgi:DNA polymerase III epsilon subunit-like protein
MKKFLIFDTECIGLDDRSIYDIAWQIVDRHGRVYDSANFLVEETITNPDIMAKAHYHKKIYSHYIPMIADGEVTIRPWQEIIEAFRADLRHWNVSAIAAYNMSFDIAAMRATHGRYGDDKSVTDGRYDALCLWQFVCESILSRPKFQKIATELGWFKTSTGNVFTNAEKAYAYISGAWGFVEDHTALSDVEIETEIFVACMKQKRTIPYNNIDGSPWALAQ